MGLVGKLRMRGICKFYVKCERFILSVEVNLLGLRYMEPTQSDRGNINIYIQIQTPWPLVRCEEIHLVFLRSVVGC
jgi:hypothetical protein